MVKGGVFVKKFYAVKVGRNTGIFETWSDCEKQVKGFSGAIYKSFTSKDEAKIFLDETNNILINQHENSNDTKLSVYVDGSYSKSQKRSGYGCVFVENEKIIHKISKEVKVEEDLWNVSAEIEGVLGAVEWSIQNGYKNLTIYHDYIGLSHWMDGTWKAKKNTTRQYVDKMNKLSANIKLKFIKVKAHSNDLLNDLADELAKQAISYDNKVSGDYEGHELDIIEDEKVSPPIAFKYETYIKIIGTDFSPKFFTKYGEFQFNDYSLEKIAKFFYKSKGNKIKDLKECSVQVDFPHLTIVYTPKIGEKWTLILDFGGQINE